MRKQVRLVCRSFSEQDQGALKMGRHGSSFEDRALWMREQQSSHSAPTPAASSFTERHYAVGEIAALWNLSADAVRKLFQDEPGVLILGGQGPTHKRRYTTLRIPESVLQRVHRRMTRV
jgi:hypothetical protein